MEERYKSLNKEKQKSTGQSNQEPSDQREPNRGPSRQGSAGLRNKEREERPDEDDDGATKCSCSRLAMYVLDIGRATNDEPVVEWLPFRSVLVYRL